MQNAALKPAGANDLEVLQELNRNYLRSAEHSDVRWYAENLAEDYMSTNPDGSLIDKEAFLARIAKPYPSSNLEAVDVRIRILGEIAIIHAGFRDRKRDGAVGKGQYTDIYARRLGRWLCVAAHFTRF